MTKTVIEKTELYDFVKEAVDNNGGYCPCRVSKTPDTKCMCKDFREQEEGNCHCGMFNKVKIEI